MPVPADTEYAHDINDVKDLKELEKLKILLSENDDLLPQNLHGPSEYGELLAQASPGQNESDVRVVKKWKGQRSQDQSENDALLVQ